MNINAVVIKMQGRSRMDAAASGALGSAASSARRLRRRVEPAPRRRARDRAPGLGSGAAGRGRRGRGGGVGAFRRGRAWLPGVPARAPPRPAPAGLPARPPVPGAGPLPPSRPGDVICTKLSASRPSRGPESSPPPARPSPSVCAELGPAGPGLTSGWQGLELRGAPEGRGQPPGWGLWSRPRGRATHRGSRFKSGVILCRLPDLGPVLWAL